MISEKISQAIVFAYEAHKGQLRHDGKPFIVHPLSVGYMLLSEGYSEDVVIAGILHDVVEDTTFTASDIEEKFGTHVKNLVLGVTEDKHIADWSLRKKAYLEHLALAERDTQAISAADLLDNRRSLLEGLQRDSQFWRFFIASPKMIIENTIERTSILKGQVTEDIILELETLTQSLNSFVSL